VEEIGKTFILNSFNFKMVNKLPKSLIIFSITEEQFCKKLEIVIKNEKYIHISDNNIIELVNKACGIKFNFKETNEIKIETGDEALIVTNENGEITFYDIWL